MKINDAGKLAVAVVGTELVGFIGTIWTTPAITSGWYANLAKPEFSPPNWIFAPVWTTLFAMMGVAVFLVWKKDFGRKSVKIALATFLVQLMLNIGWSAIFFGKQSIGGALIEIIFLWLAIFATILSFAKISRSAAWLLAPYILWVSFAGYLNFAIWTLN